MCCGGGGAEQRVLYVLSLPVERRQPQAMVLIRSTNCVKVRANSYYLQGLEFERQGGFVHVVSQGSAYGLPLYVCVIISLRCEPKLITDYPSLSAAGGAQSSDPGEVFVFQRCFSPDGSFVSRGNHSCFYTTAAGACVGGKKKKKVGNRL